MTDSGPRASRAEAIRRWVVRGALFSWGVALVTICAYLLGGHLLTLPTPSLDNPVLKSAIDARREDPEGWFALHVLYGDCGCSRRVLDHLARRGPSALAEERVVLIEPREGDIEQLEQSGLTVELMSREALGRDFAIAAAPLFVVAGPGGDLRYVGGYTGRKRGPDIEDLAILRAVRSETNPDALPLFGCAVNTQLARQVDPLGLR